MPLDATMQPRYHYFPMGPSTLAGAVDELTAAALSQLTGAAVLNCLGKQPGPPALGADLAHVVDLPAAVRADLWSALEPNLGAINTPRTSQAVEVFCARHGVEPRAVVRVIGACRFLLQRGAERAVPTALVDEDVTTLLRAEGCDDAAIEIARACVLPCYERAAAALRSQAVHEALTDHGRVVTDVKWRVDHVSHANTGEAFDVPVTLLTLRYREGDERGQVTLQLLPEELKKLHRACEDALR